MNSSFSVVNALWSPFGLLVAQNKIFDDVVWCLMMIWCHWGSWMSILRHFLTLYRPNAALVIWENNQQINRDWKSSVLAAIILLTALDTGFRRLPVWQLTTWHRPWWTSEQMAWDTHICWTLWWLFMHWLCSFTLKGEVQPQVMTAQTAFQYITLIKVQP